MANRFGECVRRLETPRLRRRGKDELGCCGQEFEPLQLRREFRLLLGLLASGNLLAKAAWMLAIECALHSINERTAAKVVRKHSRPRNRLKHDPVRSARGKQRNNQQQSANSGKHTETIMCCLSNVKNGMSH